MDPELLEELLDGEYDSQDYPITPPPPSQLIDTSQFSQIGYCVRVSDVNLGKDGRSRLERASKRLQAVWQALCRPPITATAIDIRVHGTSTKFPGMRGNVEELKRLFNSPGSALVVSGKDGLTSDCKGFLAFLESVQHPVEIFIVEEGSLYLRVSSVRLREALTTWTAGLPSPNETEEEGDMDDVYGLVEDWELISFGKDILSLATSILDVLSTRQRNMQRVNNRAGFSRQLHQIEQMGGALGSLRISEVIQRRVPHHSLRRESSSSSGSLMLESENSTMGAPHSQESLLDPALFDEHNGDGLIEGLDSPHGHGLIDPAMFHEQNNNNEGIGSPDSQEYAVLDPAPFDEHNEDGLIGHGLINPAMFEEQNGNTRKRASGSQHALLDPALFDEHNGDELIEGLDSQHGHGHGLLEPTMFDEQNNNHEGIGGPDSHQHALFDPAMFNEQNNNKRKRAESPDDLLDQPQPKKSTSAKRMLFGEQWKCKYGCKELKGDSGTATVLRGHHYRCALNPGNRSCKCEFCGKEANRDALEGHAKRCTKNPANQGLVCQYCDAKQLHREQKKRHEGKCKKKPEKDGAEEEDM